jgi:hypothetical protein
LAAFLGALIAFVWSAIRASNPLIATEAGLIPHLWLAKRAIAAVMTDFAGTNLNRADLLDTGQTGGLRG